MIELPIFLYDIKLEELGVQNETQAMLCISKDEILGCRERIAENMDELCKETCIIYTGWESFVIGISYTKMKELLK